MHWTACCIDPWFMWMWCNSSHLVGWINMKSITVLLCLWTHQQYNYQLWLQFKCNNSSTVCIDCTWWPDDNSSFLKTRLPCCNVNLTNTMATTTCEASAALSSNCQCCFQPSVCRKNNAVQQLNMLNQHELNCQLVSQQCTLQSTLCLCTSHLVPHIKQRLMLWHTPPCKCHTWCGWSAGPIHTQYWL